MQTLAHREACVGRAPKRALLWRGGGGKHLIEERGRRNWARVVWAEGNGLASEESGMRGSKEPHIGKARAESVWRGTRPRCESDIVCAGRV